MIDFATLVPTENVCILNEVPSRKGVLESLAELIAQNPSFEQRDIAEALLDREQLGSTALEDSGTAIPHCRIGNCSEPIGALLLVKSGVKFGPEMVDIVFALVVPQEATQEHLNILSFVARSFMQSEHLSQLRIAQTNEELYDKFQGQMRAVQAT